MIVFAGPSLGNFDIAGFDRLSFMPPCKQGDVYLASLENPTAIGIIDGFFEGAPSVWHKEILWAMNKGIPVLGAASMGALRAAELDHFGMIGVGQVYKGYRELVYEDDDEVALLHGPKELGSPAITLAMVNVRATVEAVHESGAISTLLAKDLLATAKKIFYKNRTWEAVVKQLSELDSADQTSDELLQLLNDNFVDQKHLDAIEMIEMMQNNDFPKSNKISIDFEVTTFWHNNTKLWRQRGFREKEQTQSDGYRLFGD